LLQFALGTAAVTARRKEEDATIKATRAAEQVRQTTAELSGFHQGTSLDAFTKLRIVDDADAKVELLTKRLIVAKTINELVKRPLPKEVTPPPLSLESLFSILRTSINDIQDDAEKIFRSHIALYKEPSLESWLSSGAQYDDGKTCPYCAQDTSGLNLIRAYRTHFNAEYTKLKGQVAKLSQALDARLSIEQITSFAAQVDAEGAVSARWSDDTEIHPPSFNFEVCNALWTDLKQHLQQLISAKQQNPVAAIGTQDDFTTANELWGGILMLMDSANESIRKNILSIANYKKSIEHDSPARIEEEIRALKLGKIRQEPEVIALISKLEENKSLEKNCNAAKKSARTELDTVMIATLGEYERTINTLLAKFGATFRIEKMDANFRGGSPRTEYGIKLRGKSVSLDGSPRFATALSDGDKRTLAFAFFVATTLADQNIEKKIILVDDPMCSLDLNRRNHTRIVLKQIYDRAQQLIVLAHDAYFLRDLRDLLKPRDGQSQIQCLEIQPIGSGYSSLAAFDVDQACESPYVHHHRVLSNFHSGEAPGDVRIVAKALRPFLEGYVHRRFPSLLPKGVMFGAAIAFIREATPPHPVAFAQSILEELSELNEFACQFHHDTNPDADLVQVTASELVPYCTRALHLVYSSSPLT